MICLQKITHWYSILSVYWIIGIGSCSIAALLSEPMGWHILLLFPIIGLLLLALPGLLNKTAHQSLPDSLLGRLHRVVCTLSKLLFLALFLYFIGIIGTIVTAIFLQ